MNALIYPDKTLDMPPEWKLIDANDEVKGRLVENLDYIRIQTLAEEVIWQDEAGAVQIELDETTSVKVQVVKR